MSFQIGNGHGQVVSTAEESRMLLPTMSSANLKWHNKLSFNPSSLPALRSTKANLTFPHPTPHFSSPHYHPCITTVSVYNSNVTPWFMGPRSLMLHSQRLSNNPILSEINSIPCIDIHFLFYYIIFIQSMSKPC